MPIDYLAAGLTVLCIPLVALLAGWVARHVQ